MKWIKLFEVQGKLRLKIWVCLLIGFGLMSGCSSVKPWQRGVLAEPAMLPDAYAVDAGLNDHIYFSKESTSGGNTIGGGGCGCN